MKLLKLLTLWPPFEIPESSVALYRLHYHVLVGPSRELYALDGPSRELYALDGPSRELYTLKGNE